MGDLLDHRAAGRRVPVTTTLDTLHARVNALGGAATTDYSRGYCAAIGDVLDIIETAGGRDPLIKGARP